jgi:hypothetical protein
MTTEPRTWIQKTQLVKAFDEWLRRYDAGLMTAPVDTSKTYGQQAATFLLQLLAEQNRRPW